MQPQFAPQNTGKIALRCGAIIGILLGIIYSAIAIMSTIQSAYVNGATVFGTLFYLITPLIWIAGLLVAGAWSSKLSGKIGTGTLAGLFGGLFGGMVAAVGQAIASAISVNLNPAPYDNSGIVILTGFATIFYILVLAIGAGAGFGALGGLIGQAISDVRPQVVPQPHPIAQTPVYQPPAVPYVYVPQQPPQPMQETPRPQYIEQQMRLPEQ